MANPTVLVPLAPGCEELEAVTIIDLLRRAGVDVVTAGLDAGPVKASRGTVLLPDTTLDQVLGKDFDMIVLPGGQPGSDHLRDDPRIQLKLKQLAGADKYVAAICAAPRALAQAGLLDGRRVTSFPGSLEGGPAENVDFVNEPVVIDGKIVTSRGPGTAMDFALSLIELLLGREMRDKVEKPLQRPAA
ncbi:MAG: DJ-1 family protein [Gammaproteobacteria bacterium]|nr:DJ-1 family protein [Gammaproteobacteria bacterium]